MVRRSHRTTLRRDAMMGCMGRLKIRIPKEIWNVYDPNANKVSKRGPRLKLILKAPTTRNRGKAIQTGPRSLKEPTHCKAKLFRFHYGGPKRQIGGQWQNEITHEQPCLQHTCANCWKWYPHLLHSPDALSGEEIGAEVNVDLEPISPDIDPRILDGTWRDAKSRRGSFRSARSSASLVESTEFGYGATPVLTPVRQSFDNADGGYQPQSHSTNPYLPTNDCTPSHHKYNIFLSAAVLAGNISTMTAPARTKWLSSSRKRYTARLAFPSHEGKQKFGVLMKERERKEKSRAYDRARRARLKEMNLHKEKERIRMTKLGREMEMLREI